MLHTRPRIYAVYINPADPAPYETAEFVEEGGSFLGFIFHILWCVYHKLWWQVAAIALVWGPLIAEGEEMGLNVLSIAAIEMFIRLLVAFEGNNWRQAKLKRQGYILSDIVTGDGEIAAKQRFFQRWLDQQPATIPATIR